MINADTGTAGKNYGFRGLLFFLLLYIIVSPFLLPYPSLIVLIHGSLSVTLLMSVWAVQKQQNHRSFAMGLLLPVLLLYWLGIYDVIPFGRIGSYTCFALYFGLLVHSFSLQILKSPRITIDVIFATLCLYIIIGMFWAALYALLYEIDPGAYSGSLLENGADSSLLTTFIYFSMVTLTTLGYGDITPQTPGAGALCQAQAIIGQFYITVVVAWLVGNFVTDKKQKETEND